MGTVPAYRRVLPPKRAVVGACSVEARTAEEVLAAETAGFAPDDVYWTMPAGDNLSRVLGKCRIVARDITDLRNLQEAAKGMQTVGLHIAADGFARNGYHGFRVEDLPALSKTLKQLPNISVCGCFCSGDLEGLHGKALGRYFRACYETAKKMTVILPCAMPYLCVGQALEAVERNRAEHPETLNDCLLAADIVEQQNRTAFYARLLIQ